MQTEFEKKLNILKVQKAQFNLRDSLDDFGISPQNQDSVVKGGSSPPPKAQVENEDGEVLDVVFDPVLKCYYHPQTNSYYDLK